jgi:hypothetical protein
MLNSQSRPVAAALLSVLVLAACNGSSTMPSSRQSIALPQRLGENAHKQNPCAKQACIYVGNEGSSIAVYPLKANGNVAPVQFLSGSNTGLNDVWAVAVDSSRNIYAANYHNYLTVYAAGSNGNVPPISTILTPPSGDVMFNPSGIGLDSTGNIYASAYSSDSLSVYSPGSSGMPTPIQYIHGTNTGILQPTSLAASASGKMYVTNGPKMSVTVYAAGSTGNAAPIQTIAGSNTGIALANAVALDSKGKIYVSSSQPGSPAGCCVDVFAKNANGNVAPLQSINGSNTQIDKPFGIAVDSNDNIYVSEGGTNSITVYAKGANGNVAPIRVVSGSKTLLNVPTDLAIH